MSRKTYEAMSVVVSRITDNERPAALATSEEWNDGDSFWIPLSVIEDGEDVEVGEESVDLHVERWWLKTRGYIS